MDLAWLRKNAAYKATVFPSGDCYVEGSMKKLDFRPMSRFISEKIQHAAIVQ